MSVWEEKKHEKWASAKLKALLVGQVVRGHGFEARLTQLKVDGECNVCIRGSKRLGIFELRLRGTWVGGPAAASPQTAPAGDDQKDGKEREKEDAHRLDFEVPAFVNEDVPDDEYDLRFVAGTRDGVPAPLVALVHKQGFAAVRAQGHVFVAQLLASTTGDAGLAAERNRRQAEGAASVRALEELREEEEARVAKQLAEAKAKKAERERASLGPKVPVKVHIFVDIKEVLPIVASTEKHKIFREVTLTVEDTVSDLADAVNTSLREAGWDVGAFPHMYLKGPALRQSAAATQAPGASEESERQLCILGAKKKKRDRSYLSGSKKLGKCLKSLVGNTIVVSPFPDRQTGFARLRELCVSGEDVSPEAKKAAYDEQQAQGNDDETSAAATTKLPAATAKKRVVERTRDGRVIEELDLSSLDEDKVYDL